MTNWFADLLAPQSAILWLGLDLLVGAVMWFVLTPIPLRWQSVTRASVWLLVPWLALMFGVTSPQAMGLSHIAWRSTLTIGLGILLSTLLLLAAARYTLRAPSEAGSDDLPQSQSHTTIAAIYTALFHGAEQFHWCFQRALVLAILLQAPWQPENPGYWAIWIAALIALPGLMRYRRGTVRLHALVALLSTSILFFYTHNFWLCWLLHAGIMILAGSAEDVGYANGEMTNQNPAGIPQAARNRGE